MRSRSPTVFYERDSCAGADSADRYAGKDQGNAVIGIDHIGFIVEDPTEFAAMDQRIKDNGGAFHAEANRRPGARDQIRRSARQSSSTFPSLSTLGRASNTERSGLC